MATPTPINGSWIGGWDLAMKRVCYDKVASILGFTDITKDVTFYPDEIAQREIAQRRGANTLEFLNLWRTPPNRNSSQQNAPLGMRGMGFSVVDTEDLTKTARVTAVNVVMPYTLRVWSKSLEKINKVAEEWLLWPYRNPTFDIYATILGKVVPLRGNLHPGALSDASQVIEKFADGRYYSISLALELQAAVFRVTSYPYANRLIVKLYYSVDPSTQEPTELLQTWQVPAE